MGKDPKTAGRQELRSLVCAQCHVSYIIPKDAEMKSTAVFFPWQGSKVGDISIENIIKVIKSSPAHGEWKQNVTGFKVGFIRHPEYEFYSRNSVHWKANAACADCHMPYMKVGANKISDHNVTSPLKNEMKACQQCHTETPQWLKDQVIAIQDRTVSLMNRSGYACAVTAKLFETAHKAQEQGKKIDEALYAPGQGSVPGGLLPGDLHRGRKLGGFPQSDRSRPHPGGRGGPGHAGRGLAAPGPDQGGGGIAGRHQSGNGQVCQ